MPRTLTHAGIALRTFCRYEAYSYSRDEVAVPKRFKGRCSCRAVLANACDSVTHDPDSDVSEI